LSSGAKRRTYGLVESVDGAGGTAWVIRFAQDDNYIFLV